MEAVSSGPRPAPAGAYEGRRGQLLSTRVLEGLMKPGPGQMVLGVTAEDLYAAGLNFVFGEADPGSGRAVISLARLGQGIDPEEVFERGPFLDRAVKEAVHETGHLLGLPHCRDPGCVMRFSNSLADTDRKSERFCPSCRSALATGGL